MNLEDKEFKCVIASLRKIKDDAKNGDKSSVVSWLEHVKGAFFDAMMKAWKMGHKDIAKEISESFIFSDEFLSSEASSYIEEDMFPEFKFIISHIKNPSVEEILYHAVAIASPNSYNTSKPEYLEYMMQHFIFDYDAVIEIGDDISEIQKLAKKYGFIFKQTGEESYRLTKRRGREDNLDTQTRRRRVEDDEMYE